MWTHPKHKGEFRGQYGYSKKGDRFFYFVNKGKRKEYSSPQAAMRDGWVYKGK